MIKEGVEAIVGLAKTAGAGIIEAKGEPPGVYYVRDGDGSLKKVKADVGLRQHAAHDMETVVQLADRFGDKASVWYSFDGVRVLVDDASRNESAFLSLKPSKQFETLAKFDNDGWRNAAMTQAEFILLLRTTFAKSGPSAGLLPVIRNLKFRSQMETAGNVQHGKASVGKAIDQQVSGATELPETIIFGIPVFESGFLFMAQIEVALEINLAAERFHLIPLPGMIAGTKQAACDAIGEFLSESIDEEMMVHGQIYRGQP